MLLTLTGCQGALPRVSRALCSLWQGRDTLQERSLMILVRRGTHKTVCIFYVYYAHALTCLHACTQALGGGLPPLPRSASSVEVGDKAGVDVKTNDNVTTGVLCLICLHDVRT
jgi:hypothetical protein